MTAMRAIARLLASGALCPCVVLGAVSSRAAEPLVKVAPSQDVAWLDCTFSPIGGKPPVQILLLTAGDRVERAVVAPLGMADVDVSRLKAGPARISGKLVIGHERRANNRSIPRLAARMPLTLDLTVNGSQVLGTFEGQWPKSEKDVTVAADVQGAVRGERRDEAAMKKDFGLPAGGTWPCWVGPNQNFSSGPCAVPLVEDLNRARLVWASQYIGPPESGSRRYGACAGVPPAAGGATPLVADGKVYQFRYEPAGEAYQKHLDDQMAGERADENRRKIEAVGWTMAEMRRRWALDADEQLVCLDAATGKTLWTITWPCEGLNFYDHKCSLTNHTGVVADGKAFVFGGMGIVRCVDGASGQVLWRVELPGYAEAMRKMKQVALEKRELSAPTRSFLHGLNISGKTVVAPDSYGSGGLVGLEAATGKPLWHAQGVLGSHVTPLAWSKDGKDYVITATDRGVVTCLRADDGAAAWTYDKAGAFGGTPLLAGDLLLVPKLTEGQRKALPKEEPGDAPASAPGENVGQVACLALSPRGAVEKWVSPVEWGAPWYSPVGTASGEWVCFRGNYRYHIVNATTGERLASTVLSAAVRWDEGTMLALPGLFIPHPDSQHGSTKLFAIPAAVGATCGPMWSPPHPHATTYEVAMSHAWVDGRLFIRGADAVYCYDLRKPSPARQ